MLYGRRKCSSISRNRIHFGLSDTAADAETRILGQPVNIGKLQRGSRILIRKGE